MSLLNKLNFFLRKYYSIPIFLFFTLIIVSWSRMKLVAFNDWEIPFTFLDTDNYLSKNFSGWMMDNFGYQTPFTHLKAPYISLVFLLISIGTPVEIVQFIFLVSPFLLVFYGFRKISIYFFNQKNLIISYIGGFCYSLSIPFLFVYGMFGPLYMFSYAALPLVFFYSLRIYSAHNFRERIIFSIKFALSIYFFVLNSNIATAVSIFFFVFPFLFFIDKDKVKLKKRLKKFFLAVVTISIFLVLFLLPFLIENIDYLRNAYINNNASSTQLFSESWYRNNKIWEIFRSGAFFNWYQTIGKDRFIPYTFYFKETFNLFLSFSITVFSLISILLFRRKSYFKIVIILLIFYLFGILLINGLNSPFGSVNKFLFEHIPFFSMFRQAYTKIGLINQFILSLLLMFTFSYFYKNPKSYKKSLYISAAVLSLIFLNAWPLIKESPMKTIYSEPILSLPDDILRGVDYINDIDNDQSIIIVPSSNYPLYDFGYLGANFYPYLINKRLIRSGASNPILNDSINEIYDNLSLGEFQTEKLLENNIGYVLYQKSIDRKWNPFRKTNLVDERIFIGNKNLNQLINSENLSLYKINSDKVKPLFYFSNKDSEVKISYKKFIGNSFVVDVRGLDSQEFLNFLQNYNSNWDAVLVNKKEKDSLFYDLFFGKKLLHENYNNDSPFNRWQLDAEQIKKNISSSYYYENPDGSIDLLIMVRFKSDVIFYISMFFSIIFILSSCFYLLWNWISYREKKIEHGKDKNKLE